MLRVGDHLVVLPQALDRRRPVQRTATNPAGCSPLVEEFHDVIRVTGCRRQPGVFEIVDADLEAASDFVGTVRVRHHRQPVLVRFVDDGLCFLVGHLVLVDQLDDVDAGIGQPLDLGTGVPGAVDAPAKRLGPRVGAMLDERAGDEQARPGNLAVCDPLFDRDRIVEGCAEVARGSDTREQQLLGRGRHDLRFETVDVVLVPVLVIRVAVQHQVHVHVPEAGEHRHALGRDHFIPGGYLQRVDCADGNDGVALDEDHAVRDRIAEQAVDEPAADERFPFIGVTVRAAEQGDRQDDEKGNTLEKRHTGPGPG